jgi:beta-aspartyl-peptidase (threonine type)
MGKIALAIHGGAGTIRKAKMTPVLEMEYRGGLENALMRGWEVLQKDGTALNAVEAAVVALEDFHLFNAGRGAVFTHEGEIELDASIMDGENLRSGAVTFVKNIKNPVRLARLVMERSDHVLLAGEGANQFADEMGVDTEPDEYFFTEHRWLELQEAMAAGRVQLDHSDDDGDQAAAAAGSATKPIGTVGAVACDSRGNLAAATSTGGMTNKKFGRVGDTPIVGSGFYAENSTCAVSCTGHGEYFMLGASAYDLAARMKYKGLSLEDAGKEVINRLTEIGGEGGLIAVNSEGNVTLQFNSQGMYRGYAEADGSFCIDIYGAEPPA